MVYPWTYRLDILGKELVVCLVHGGKVVHGGQEDIDLDDILQATARFL